MKSFKDYLTESVKTYEFKVKIAGDVSEAGKTIKIALDQYKVNSVSGGKRLPIAETHTDFPEHKNVNVTIFEVTLAYPANSVQVRAAVSDKLGLSLDCVKVRNMKEEEEIAINHEFDQKSGKALLGTDYEVNSDGQKVVGEKHAMGLLKELSKTKHTGDQYKGANDTLLASSAPTDTSHPVTKPNKKASVSPLGSRKVTLPTAKGL